MATLTLNLLGDFSAEQDGQPLRFGYDKMRALLAYLAVEHDRPHRRQSLATLLWPEHDKRGALGNLSQALYKLRTAVGEGRNGEPLLRISPQTLQLNINADIRIDAVEFADTIQACVGHAHVDLIGCAECLNRLLRAVDLYQGRFLDGIAVDDSPEFDEWLLMTRERYQRLAGEALESLAAGFEQRRQQEKALDYARRRLVLEPWHEATHRQIMRLLAESDDRTGALAQYEACRRVLAAELAVDPSDETVALYERIRDPANLHASSAKATNLPTPLTALFGRTAELTTLRSCLSDPACRLITLVGLGGSGKTRLAIEAATQTTIQFADGVVYVPLVSLDGAEAIAPALAQALGLTLTGQEAVPAQVLNFLRRREMLLVLDNFEHLIDGLPLITDLLRSAPQVKVLITSRVQLHAPAEQVIAVHGLQVSQTTPDGFENDPATLADSDAVSLFLYHVRRRRPDYAAATADLDAIVRICRFVSGMPLGILLASAWLDVLSPQEIASRLAGEGEDVESSGLALLETDSPGLPERQRSMRVVFDQTWSLLTPRQQQMLAAISIFRGSFTYEAARAVAKVTIRQVKELVDRSLLQRRADGRYEIHELLRQFAAEQLATRSNEHIEDSVAIRDRHAAFYADAAHQWGEELKGRGQVEAIKAMDADLDNLRVAWAWMARSGQTTQIDRSMDGFLSFYDWRGTLQPAERACRLACDPFESAGTPSHPQTHARLLTWHARFLRLLGRVDEARTLLDRSLALLEEMDGNDTATVNALAAALGEQSTLVEDFDRARSIHLREQSLALYRQVGNRSGMATALRRRGKLAADMGEFISAHGLLDESLALAHSLGDRRSTAAILDFMATACATQGMLERSQTLGRQAAALHEELGDKYSACTGMLERASWMAYAGQFRQANALYDEVATASDELGARVLYATAVHLGTWMRVNLGDYAEAKAQHQRVDSLFEEGGNRRGQAMQLLGIGEIALVQGELDAATSTLAESAAIFRAISQWDEYAIALSGLAFAQRALGDHSGARESVFEAMQIVRRIGAFAPAHMAIEAQSLLLADAGEIERSIEYHALVMAHPYFGNSVFRKDLSGQIIDEHAGALSPEQVRTAQECGVVRDIWATVDEILAEYETAAVLEDGASPCQT